MPKYAYQWRNTEKGRRLFRVPGSSSVTNVSPPTSNVTTPSPPPSDDDETLTIDTDYSGLSLAELRDEAESRGLKSYGTKADIAARLEADDE